MATYPEEIKRHALNLHAQGWSQNAIGRELGVPQPTIGRWVNPAIAERGRLKSRKYHATHKDSIRARQKQYHINNREAQLERSRQWRTKNREAHLEYARTYYLAHREKRIAYNKEWRRQNYEYHREQCRRWRENNKEQRRRLLAAWHRRNPGKASVYTSCRRANKRKAQPLWLSEEQLNQIDALYDEARRLEKVTGQKYHVDHIIPFKAKALVDGKYVHVACGLHVPWNLCILPTKQNLQKHCKLGNLT